MRRGEIWTVSGGRTYAGKPRPALILQDDRFDATDSVTLCPFTTSPADAPLFRSPARTATCPDTVAGYSFGIDMNETAPRLSWRFAEALTLSADLHAHQKRKGTDVPYISHLLAVASIALDHGADEEEAIAALLHDAIEDAPTPLGPDWVRRTIQHRFGPRVLKIVEGCTDTDEQPKPAWRVRKARYIAHLPTQDRDVLLVSAADKLHNATAILRDHRELGHDLWVRFNKDAGKAGTIGYYRALVSAYRRAAGHHPRLVAELDAVVKQIEDEAGQAGAWPPPEEDE